jgi:excisionase family DNA binding protein
MTMRHESPSDLLTVKEVAERLRVSKPTVCRLVSGNHVVAAVIPSIRLGRRILVRRGAIEQFLIALEKIHEPRPRRAAKSAEARSKRGE